MITNSVVIKEIRQFNPCLGSLDWLASLDPNGNPLEALEQCPDPEWFVWLAFNVFPDTMERKMSPIWAAYFGMTSWATYSWVRQTRQHLAKEQLIEWLRSL